MSDGDISDLLHGDADTGSAERGFNGVVLNNNITAVHQKNSDGIVVIVVSAYDIAAGIHEMQGVAVIPALVVFYNIVVGIPDDHITGIVNTVFPKSVAVAGPATNAVASQAKRGSLGRNFISGDLIIMRFLHVDAEQRILDPVVGDNIFR